MVKNHKIPEKYVLASLAFKAKLRDHLNQNKDSHLQHIHKMLSSKSPVKTPSKTEGPRKQKMPGINAKSVMQDQASKQHNLVKQNKGLVIKSVAEYLLKKASGYKVKTSGQKYSGTYKPPSTPSHMAEPIKPYKTTMKGAPVKPGNYKPPKDSPVKKEMPSKKIVANKPSKAKAPEAGAKPKVAAAPKQKIQGAKPRPAKSSTNYSMGKAPSNAALNSAPKSSLTPKNHLSNLMSMLKTKLSGNKATSGGDKGGSSNPKSAARPSNTSVAVPSRPKKQHQSYSYGKQFSNAFPSPVTAKVGADIRGAYSNTTIFRPQSLIMRKSENENLIALHKILLDSQKK